MDNNLYLGISVDYNKVTASYIYGAISDLVRFDGKPYLKVFFNQNLEIKNFVDFLWKSICEYLKNNIPESFFISKTVVSLPCDLETCHDEVNNAIFYDLIDEMINSGLFGENVYRVYAPISASFGALNLFKSLNIERNWPIYFLFFNLKEKDFDINLTRLDENNLEILIEQREFFTLRESNVDDLVNIIERSLLRHQDLSEKIDVALITGDLFIFK